MQTLSPDDLDTLNQHGITLLAPLSPTRNQDRGHMHFLAEKDGRQTCHAIVLGCEKKDQQSAVDHWNDLIRVAVKLADESWIQRIFGCVQLSSSIVILCEELQNWNTQDQLQSYEEVKSCLTQVGNGLLKMRSQGLGTTTIDLADIKVRPSGEVVLGGLIPWRSIQDSRPSTHPDLQILQTTVHLDMSAAGALGARRAPQSTGIAVLLELSKQMRARRACPDPRINQLIATLREIAEQYGDAAIGNAILYVSQTDSHSRNNDVPENLTAQFNSWRPRSNKRMASLNHTPKNQDLTLPVTVAWAHTKHPIGFRGAGLIALLIVAGLIGRGWWNNSEGNQHSERSMLFAQKLDHREISALILQRYEYLSELTTEDPAQVLTPESLAHAPSVVVQTVRTAERLVEQGYELNRPVVTVIDSVVTRDNLAGPSSIQVTYAVSYQLGSVAVSGTRDHTVLESGVDMTPKTSSDDLTKLGRNTEVLVHVSQRTKTTERATMQIKQTNGIWSLVSVT